MNASEGLQRIAMVIRYAGRFLTALFILGAVTVPMSSESDKWLLIGLALGLSALIYASSAALAWIVDGFAKPSDTKQTEI